VSSDTALFAETVPPPETGRKRRFPPHPRLAALPLSLAALAAALLFTFSFTLPPVLNDSAEYLDIARNLAAGKGFTQDGAAPMLYRPPLFSLLLGGWFLLTGTSSPLSAAVFQSLVHASSVAIAFLLFLEFAPSLAWAAAGGLFLALNPLLVTRVVFVLQEPTILLTTTLAAWLSVRLLRDPSRGRAAAAGAAWGVCTLAKVVAWFAPFLLLAMRFLPGRLRRDLKNPEAAVLLLCFAATVAPWTLRNYVHTGRFILVNDQGGGMLEWNVLQAKVPGEPPGAEFVERLRDRRLDEAEKNRLLRGYVLEHPWYFFALRPLRNAWRFMNPPRDWWWTRGMYGPGQPRPWYWTVHDHIYRLFFLFLLYRSFQALRGRYPAPEMFIVLFVAGYWGLHSVLLGGGRFAIPVYPLLVAAAFPRRSDQRADHPPTEGREGGKG
jgi:4-amino-4-deoxy-L-arabinose transferase-like glycosyltransferase